MEWATVRRGTIGALVAAVSLAGGASFFGRLLPPRFSPLAPLNVAEEPVPLVTALTLLLLVTMVPFIVLYWVVVRRRTDAAR